MKARTLAYRHGVTEGGRERYMRKRHESQAMSPVAKRDAMVRTACCSSLDPERYLYLFGGRKFINSGCQRSMPRTRRVLVPSVPENRHVTSRSGERTVTRRASRRSWHDSSPEMALWSFYLFYLLYEFLQVSTTVHTITVIGQCITSSIWYSSDSGCLLLYNHGLFEVAVSWQFLADCRLPHLRNPLVRTQLTVDC